MRPSQPPLSPSPNSFLTGPAHTRSNRYGTPKHITAKVQSFFTKPLFDPCPWGPVADGLLIDWTHSVFLNPPYSSGQLDQWEAKARFEVKEGHTKEIVWLINYGCTRARKRIAQQSSAIVHLHKRISFIDPDTEEPIIGNDRDSMLYIWHYDSSPQRLLKFFEPLGTVFVRPKKRPNFSFSKSILFLRGERFPPAANRSGDFCFPFS